MFMYIPMNVHVCIWYIRTLLFTTVFTYDVYMYVCTFLRRTKREGIQTKNKDGPAPCTYLCIHI